MTLTQHAIDLRWLTWRISRRLSSTMRVCRGTLGRWRECSLVPGRWSGASNRCSWVLQWGLPSPVMPFQQIALCSLPATQNLCHRGSPGGLHHHQNDPPVLGNFQMGLAEPVCVTFSAFAGEFRQVFGRGSSWNSGQETRSVVCGWLLHWVPHRTPSFTGWEIKSNMFLLPRNNHLRYKASSRSNSDSGIAVGRLTQTSSAKEVAAQPNLGRVPCQSLFLPGHWMDGHILANITHQTQPVYMLLSGNHHEIPHSGFPKPGGIGVLRVLGIVACLLLLWCFYRPPPPSLPQLLDPPFPLDLLIKTIQVDPFLPRDSSIRKQGSTVPTLWAGLSLYATNK